MKNVDFLALTELEALRHEISSTQDLKYLRRLYATMFLSSGISSRKVAETIGESPRTVQRWAQRFAAEGVEGLRIKKPNGRPAMIDASIRSALASDVSHSPKLFKYPARFWTAALLAEHLQHKYGIALSLRQCMRVLGDLPGRKRGSPWPPGFKRERNEGS